MKTLICLIVMLAIAKYSQSAAANCALASYCQSCGSGATACDSCLSWGLGDLKDKVFATSSATTCTGAMPTAWKVADCKLNYGYNAATLNASTTVASTNHPRCQVCNSKKFLYYATNATTETCSDTAPTTMSTCTEITNCVQTVCDTTSGAQVHKCLACNAGYYPTTINSTSGYNTTCGSVATAITNCSIYTHVTSGGSTTYRCAKCASGYAASSDNSTCTAHTGTGCAKLQTDNANCAECDEGYFFSGATCINTGITTGSNTTKAYSIALVGLVAFVSLFVLQ